MLFSKQTPAAGGDAFAQFDAAWCYDGNGYIFNDTGTSLDVRIGASGSVQTVAAGKTLPIKLVYSMAELYVRRTDRSPTQVTVEAIVGLNAGAADGGGGGTSGPVAAADITDAGTAGIAVLQAETPAQARTALGADPSGTAATAVSTHNTAPDAHADIRTLVAGKQDSLTISDVGEAMLALATPSGQKIPRINADGSVTLIDPRRGLYSGIMSVAVPTQANTGLTTWVNQGDATAADTPIGLQVVNPTTSSSNDNIRGLVMPVPDTPYTLTALLELASTAGNFPCALLGWADDESTKTHLVSLCGDGRSGLVSPTGSSFTFADAPQFTRDGRRVWLRFSDDGTDITVQWSISGVYWHALYSKAKASSHLGSEGYNRLFFGASSHSITGVATLLSWSIS